MLVLMKTFGGREMVGYSKPASICFILNLFRCNWLLQIGDGFSACSWLYIQPQYHPAVHRNMQGQGESNSFSAGKGNFLVDGPFFLKRLSSGKTLLLCHWPKKHWSNQWNQLSQPDLSRQQATEMWGSIPHPYVCIHGWAKITVYWERSR